MLTKQLLDTDRIEVPYVSCNNGKEVYFSSMIIVPITVSNRVFEGLPQFDLRRLVESCANVVRWREPKARTTILENTFRKPRLLSLTYKSYLWLDIVTNEGGHLTF